MGDLIFINANVMTMDPACPAAEVVAVKGSRILSVSKIGNLDRLRGAGAPIIDCAHRTIVPGFIDAHCHVRAYAESLATLDLSPREGIRSIGAMQGRIQELRRSLAPGTWIRGKGYDEFYLAEGRHPNRQDLDAVAPLHPVKLTHRSGHAHVLNSLALGIAGITAETEDPPDGFIDRDLDTGEPTGILYGMRDYLTGKIPPIDDAAMEQGLARANVRLLACGITSVQDASSANDASFWKKYVSWKARGVLQPRITMMLGAKRFAESRQNIFALDSIEADPRLGGVKIILNRATGDLRPDREELDEMVLAIHAAGLQTIIHAVEEPEIEAACNAVAYAMKMHPRPNPRHRIEHCSVCPPGLLQKISDLGISVVTQPSFIYFSGERYLKTVPEEQRGFLYPIGSMHNKGLRIGFSSDFPISDPNPLIGIGAAVTRMAEDGNTVLEREAISVQDALRMYTLSAAAAAFEEGIKGSITPGKLADFVILNGNPCAVDPGRIKDIRPAMTVLGGRIVWNDGTLSL